MIPFHQLNDPGMFMQLDSTIPRIMISGRGGKLDEKERK
jgi:hypothetical protein